MTNFLSFIELNAQFLLVINNSMFKIMYIIIIKGLMSIKKLWFNSNYSIYYYVFLLKNYIIIGVHI